MNLSTYEKNTSRQFVIYSSFYEKCILCLNVFEYVCWYYDHFNEYNNVYCTLNIHEINRTIFQLIICIIIPPYLTI